MGETGTDDHPDKTTDGATASRAIPRDDAPGPPQLNDIVRALEDDRDGVQAVARAVVGSGSAMLADWSVVPLSGGRAGNVTTGGLFRVAGHVDIDGRVDTAEHVDAGAKVRAGAGLQTPAQGQGAEDLRRAGRKKAWTAVLKVVRSPVETEWPSDVPDEGIYWRREVELARSGLLDGVRGLVPPRTYATVERPAASAWLWIEDLGDLGRPEWSDSDYVFAARALARFHAPYLTGTPLPDVPWLSTDFTRRFHAAVLPYYEELMGWIGAGAPAFAPLQPDAGDPGLAAMHRVMTAPEPLLTALDSTPQVLCHGDANVDNLFIRARTDGERELVALDWQMAGPASIGCDLGQLLADVRPTDRAARERTVAAVLQAYRDQLRAAGADVDAQTVALACAADAAVRQTVWAFLQLYFTVTGMAAHDDEDAVAELVATFARSTVTAGPADLARHALELVDGSRHRQGPADHLR